jgi:DNA-binding transcriptional ArsR family regulator
MVLSFPEINPKKNISCYIIQEMCTLSRGLRKNLREAFDMAGWTFFSNHGLVMVSIAKDPNRTARQIGDEIGLTERTVHRIIVDLEEAGYIERVRMGRQNTYTIDPDRPIKDLVTDSSIGELLASLAGKRRAGQAESETSRDID